MARKHLESGEALVEGAAEHIGYSPHTLRKYAQLGIAPSTFRNIDGVRRRVFNLSELEKWKAERDARGTAAGVAR